MFWWRRDLQPSLDRVRSASTTCLRPEPNFHFLDRDRYELLLLKWTILQKHMSLPRCSTCSFCWVILTPLSFSWNILLLFVAFISHKNQTRLSVWGFVLLPLNEKKKQCSISSNQSSPDFKESSKNSLEVRSVSSYYPIIVTHYCQSASVYI